MAGCVQGITGIHCPLDSNYGTDHEQQTDDRAAGWIQHCVS